MGRQIGVFCPRGYVSHDDCRACALKPDHPCDYTPDMLEQMRIDYDDPDREPGIDSFTPTRLLGCARQPVLMADHDYYVDVDHAWPLVRGNMVHALMESARYPGAVKAIREQRLKTTVQTRFGPQTFTAKPDIVVIKSIDLGYRQDKAGITRSDDTIHVKIVDYKSIGDIGHDLTEAKFDHQLQVNMYAWIVSRELPRLLDLEGAKVVIDELEVVYVSMKKVRRFSSAAGHFTKGKMLQRRPPVYDKLWLEPILLMSLDEAGRFIRDKIEERLGAHEQLPDILEGDAAWLCDRCPVRELCYSIGNQRRAA